MGTYQKMKQAEKVVKLMTTNYEEHKDDPELSEMSMHRLESAREKYRSLKYEYDVQRTLLVFSILSLAGILYVAITRGVI